MEWLVKKSCCNKQDNRHVIMLCDAGGAIKMIAEVKSDFAVKVGDLLSPFDAPRDKCTLSCAINGIHAAFHYLKKNYISGCVMTVPTG